MINNILSDYYSGFLGFERRCKKKQAKMDQESTKNYQDLSLKSEKAGHFPP